MGDWNCEPGELVETTWLRRIKGHILCPHQATLATGNKLDYAVLSKELRGCITAQVQHDGPWGPHYGILFTWHTGATQEHIQVLQNTIPLTQCLGPRLPWQYFQYSQAIDLHKMPPTPSRSTSEELTQVFGQFQAQATHWLASTSLVQNPPTRGISFQLHMVPQQLRAIKEITVQDKQLQFWLGLRRMVRDCNRLLKGPLHSKQTSHAGLLQQSINNKTKHLQIQWPSDSQGFSWLGMQRGLKQMLSNRPFLNDNDKMEEFLHKTCHTLQKQAWERKKEEFAIWAEAAMRKGARQAHAFIKQDKANYLRPYQNLPLAQRPAARRAYWRQYWQEEEPDRATTPAKETLKQEAIQEAQTLKPISSAQIKATLQHMGKKKPGPDGWTIQELQQWPEQALSSPIWVYHQIEATGEWPAQATYTQIALLPKSLDNERPICLTNFFYRLWATMRFHLLKKWLHQIKDQCPWDKAMPQGTIFDISFQRQLSAEFSKGLQLQQGSILIDLKHFYDTVDRQRLITAGKQLSFPPIIMHHAMIIHAAPRWLCAESQADHPFHTRYSIIAGCPFSVTLAKVYLWQTCSQIYQIHPSLVVSSWVDDISIDMVGKSSQFVAKILAQVLNKLDIKVQELNLILSKHKSGFLVSSNELKKAFKEIFPKNAPAIKGVLKDLGCDSTGGRLRRLPTQKARLQKGKRRLTRLRALPKKHGKRFTYTNIMPAVNIGYQTLGYSKTQLQKLRVMVGQAGAIKKGNGCLHITIRTIFGAKYDPGIYMPTEHFIMVFKFLQRKSHIQLKIYNQVWQALAKELYNKPNHWSLVKGPLAACIAYLKDNKWKAPDMHKWTAPDGSQWELDFKDPDLAWEFTEQFQGMAEATGWAQSAKRPGSQGLAEGGDLIIGKRHR